MTAKQGAALNAKLKQMAMEKARAERDAALRQAVAEGVSLRKIAEIVGLSHQRVAQIVAETGTPKREGTSDAA